MDYNTEEQQIKALKDWWSENGTSIIVGIVIGVGGFWGYNWWQDKTVATQEAASNSYQSLVDIDAKENSEQFVTAANTIKEEYADTGYAILAALHLAKQHVDNGEFAKAQEQLEWTVKQTQGQKLQPLMKIRLARVLNAQQKFDEALAQLNSIQDEAYAGVKQQVLGDTYLLKGDQDRARLAYETAKQSTESYSAKNELEMKVNDLAPTTKIASETDAEAVETESSETQQDS